MLNFLADFISNSSLNQFQAHVPPYLKYIAVMSYVKYSKHG